MASCIPVPVPQCSTCRQWESGNKKCGKNHVKLSPGVADSGCQDYLEKKEAPEEYYYGAFPAPGHPAIRREGN